MRPLIGITSFDDHKTRSIYASINANYLYSIDAAGGFAAVLPGPSGLRTAGSAAEPGDDELAEAAEAYAARLDGLLLSGGGDVSPRLLGRSPSRGLARFESDRDRWELALFAAARRRGLPVLGVCRGCQVVNVALGGGLYDDLPTDLPGSGGHSFDVPMDELSHFVDIEPGSRLASALGGTRLPVNSFHHQAARGAAPGLVVTARADDGVIEALESPEADGYLVAVQFHPEGLTRRYPAFLGVFRGFVEAARR